MGSTLPTAIVILFAIVIGTLCALFRFRVPVILAVSAMLASGAVASKIVLQANPWMIAAEAVGSVTVLQFVYVIVWLMRHYLQSRAAIPQMRSAIGQSLRAELEVPRNLLPELASLVAQLEAPGPRLVNTTLL